MPDSNTPETQALLPVTAADRDIAQFFFEMGFGACYAEAIVRNGNQVPFPLSDAEIERQWAISQEAYDDADELEAMLSLARHRQSSSNAGGVEAAWERLKTLCCDRPTSAGGLFMVNKSDFFAALASLSTPTAEPMGPYASDRDLIEAAVQASLDAGLAENGVHGVAAARHAARFVVESREYWRNIERANLAAEVRQIKEAKQAPAIPADIGMNLAAAFGPILKEAFPEHSAQHRHAACDALAEAVVARAGWFATPTTPPTPDRIGKDAVREADLHANCTEALLRHRGCDVPSDRDWSAVQFGEIAASDVRAILAALTDTKGDRPMGDR